MCFVRCVLVSCLLGREGGLLLGGGGVPGEIG